MTPIAHRPLRLSRRGAALLAFVLLATALVTLEPRLVLPAAGDPRLLEVGVTADLLLMPPLLYWLLLVRPGLARAWTVLVVFVAAAAAAELVLPAGRRGTLHALRWLPAAGELGLLAFLAVRVRRGVRTAGAASADVLDRTRAAAAQVFGSGVVADAVAYEAALLAYLFARGKAPTVAGEVAEGEVAAGGAAAGAFTFHRKSGYGGLLFAMVLAVSAETLPVHLLVSRWSGLAAWILTALSVYTVVWLLADYRALARRPTRVDARVLRLRFGLRWSLDLPLAHVRHVSDLVPPGTDKRSVDLRLALPGARWLVVELAEPVPARGPYGVRRSVRTIGLALDDPEAFRRALGAMT